RRWLTPAANRGHPYAQFLLAKLLEAGEGGPADAASAAKYYEPAANFGIAEAQYQLGVLLASDRSNGANLSSAYKWLVLAGGTPCAPAESLAQLWVRHGKCRGPSTPRGQSLRAWPCSTQGDRVDLCCEFAGQETIWFRLRRYPAGRGG